MATDGRALRDLNLTPQVCTGLRVDVGAARRRWAPASDRPSTTTPRRMRGLWQVH